MKYLIATLSAIIILTMPEIAKPGDPKAAGQSQVPMFSFGVIADVQYCNCEPAGTRFYSRSLSKLREALTSLRKDSAQFVVNLGDLIERGYESYQPVLDIIDSSGFRVYHCIGNHDYSVDARFKRRLPIDRPSKEGYYSAEHKGFRLIFLDGNELSTYASVKRSALRNAEEYLKSLRDEGRINAVEWNGAVNIRQIEWLIAQLDESVSGNEKVIIFCHFPVFPENVHNLLNYKEILSVLSGYQNIIAWFNGHNHAGNYGNFNKIHFLTMKGMVETETSGSFALVEVYRNKIWIRGSGREKGQILAY
jgi:manganese-dependent ADP-ribose/CDP-alcohol diphosphatase